jgi:tetratricopeptide (TPR) repeat protein
MNRGADLTIARLHLRLGALVIARAELELLAEAGELDGPGRVDLAEVRWRTGDLARAGEAAAEALTILDDDPVALVIAAEAAAALGRPNEARRLANRALDCVAGSIDATFAGMPRSAVWPADAAEPAPTAATLFHQEPISAPTRRLGDSDAMVPSTLRAAAGEPTGLAMAARATATPGFWDLDPGIESTAPALPDPGEELDAATRALAAGALDEAALRFALTLRLAPSLAPAVLEATESAARAGGAATAGPAGPTLSVVRGDAFRLVGLETEARRAYALAAWSGSRDRRHTLDPDPAGEPASDTIPRVQRPRTQGRHARN